MAKLYFTGNVIYLPINPIGLQNPDIYMVASVSGDLYTNDLHTAESLEEKFKRGEIKQCNMIMPTINEGFDYKRVW